MFAHSGYVLQCSPLCSITQFAGQLEIRKPTLRDRDRASLHRLLVSAKVREPGFPVCPCVPTKLSLPQKASCSLVDSLPQNYQTPPLVHPRVSYHQNTTTLPLTADVAGSSDPPLCRCSQVQALHARRWVP